MSGIEMSSSQSSQRMSVSLGQTHSRLVGHDHGPRYLLALLCTEELLDYGQAKQDGCTWASPAWSQTCTRAEE